MNMGGERRHSSPGGAEKQMPSLLVAYAAMPNVVTVDLGNIDLMYTGEMVTQAVHDGGKCCF